MHIAKDETIAGHPALTVRAFLRRNHSFTFGAGAAARELGLSDQEARDFLVRLQTLALIEPAEVALPEGEAGYEIAIKGNALANASAAKPIRRSTAELALKQFLERLDRFNASGEYVYRVESAVLFGSMLSPVERLGDVDIAIELVPTVSGDEEFRSRSDARRKLATRSGAHFGSMVDYVLWPKAEVFRALKARSRALSLHEWDQIKRIPGVRYRILMGDRKRIAQMISNGERVDA
jgi:hypothetical protein